jgi:hypothetical protein
MVPFGTELRRFERAAEARLAAERPVRSAACRTTKPLLNRSWGAGAAPPSACPSRTCQTRSGAKSCKPSPGLIRGGLCRWKILRHQPIESTLPFPGEVDELHLDCSLLGAPFFVLPSYRDIEWLEIVSEVTWQPCENAPPLASHGRPGPRPACSRISRQARTRRIRPWHSRLRVPLVAAVG